MDSRKISPLEVFSIKLNNKTKEHSLFYVCFFTSRGIFVAAHEYGYLKIVCDRQVSL